MDKNQGENTALEESIERKLREAESQGAKWSLIRMKPSGLRSKKTR